MSLSILCVTRAVVSVRPFLREFALLADRLQAELVFGAHGAEAREFLTCETGVTLDGVQRTVVPVEGEFLEQMLSPALEACTGDYVLRLDDDERCSEDMVRWLELKVYEDHDSWFFPRFHLWPDADHVITTSPFFPDFQGRVTTRDKAHRPPTLHSASPYPAYRAPVYIEHHNFLIKTYQERQGLTAQYETIKTGKIFAPEEIARIIVMPEDGPNLRIEPKAPSLQEQTALVRWWREAGNKPPVRLQQELQDWVNRRDGSA